jgi:hypothetical protein
MTFLIRNRQQAMATQAAITKLSDNIPINDITNAAMITNPRSKYLNIRKSSLQNKN